MSIDRFGDKPIKFLGATVLSFNSSIGYGSAQESTLNIDLIEDCQDGDYFLPQDNLIEVGSPVYFQAGDFVFGGVLTNWTVSQSSAGRVFNVKVVDPRQLLDNVMIVLDSYLGPPLEATNYYNVYAAYEQQVLQGDCNVFGIANSNERGMNYNNIINMLKTDLIPVIYSPTGYPFYVNFESFPSNMPSYYRITGPAISLLQLLQEACDVAGFDFFVTLNNGFINIGLVDVKAGSNNFSNFRNILNNYNGIASEMSYGEELRNEKTKSLIFGEQIHYLTFVNNFIQYFGEDLIGNQYIPVVPYGYNEYGFWFAKMVTDVNVTLNFPLPGNGPFTISEADIKAAMASRSDWEDRVFSPLVPGTFNAAIRAAFGNALNNTRQLAFNIISPNLNVDPIQLWKSYADYCSNPSKPAAERNKPTFMNDIDKLHSFVVNLGSTYYGKQFIGLLNQQICVTQNEDFGELKYSDVPTAAGGWVDPGITVLGLNDPELDFFRENDGRIGCIAYFNTEGTVPI
jgi:hypothetical protein